MVVGSISLVLLMSACETKSPVGPGAEDVRTTTTTTTTVPGTSTSTSSTTTTMVLGSLARSFSSFQAPLNQISQMTLFFEVQVPGSPEPTLSATTPRDNLDSVYRVTGVYAMGNGTTGNITGTLSGAVDPLQTGGRLELDFTARTPSGCTAERHFDGSFTPQTLVLGPDGSGTSTCVPSPLDLETFTMFRTDQVPLPTTTSTSTTSTTSTSTTSTSTTSTSTICSYTVTPTIEQEVRSIGGAVSYNISTGSGCQWSIRSFDSFIIPNSPMIGTGSAMVSFLVQLNNTDDQRQGSVEVAGQTRSILQYAPADLTIEQPDTSDPYCDVNFDSDSNAWILDVGIRNADTDDAGASRALVTFRNLDVSGNPTSEITPVVENVVPIARDDVETVRFRIPENYFPGVLFTIRIDIDNSVPEGTAGEANNVAEGACNVSFGLGIKRQAVLKVPQRETVPAPVDHTEDIRSSNAAVLRRR